MRNRERGDDGYKIDGGTWRAEMRGTTVDGDAADMSRDVVEMWDDWDNKKDADGG